MQVSTLYLPTFNMALACLQYIIKNLLDRIMLVSENEVDIDKTRFHIFWNICFLSYEKYDIILHMYFLSQP